MQRIWHSRLLSRGRTTGVCLLFLCHLALAQGTAEQYEQAASLRERTSDKVFRSRIDLHWVGDGPRGWYRTETGLNASRWIRFDAAEGTRQDAFDHDRLAAALSVVLRREILPDQLTIRDLEFNADWSRLFFDIDSRHWRCQLGDYTLSEVDARGTDSVSTASILSKPRGSRRGGEETSVEFHNRLTEAVSLYWIEADGIRTLYTEIPAGKSHRQRTFAGHVWLALNSRGETVGVFEATNRAATAIIDGNWSEQAQPDQRQRDTSGERSGSDEGGSRSPDGLWLARIENHNVQLVDRETAESHPLSTSGTAEDPYVPHFVWSPDSSRLAVLQEQLGEKRQVTVVESSPDDQLQPRVHSFEYVKPGDRIDRPRPRLFKIETREPIPVGEELFSNPWSISELNWSPDSREFTFLYNERGHQLLRVIAIDATTGAARIVIDEQSPTFICYSSKLFYHRLPETSEVIWMSERDGWNHLYLYDAATGQVKNQITQGDWVVRGVDRVDADQRQIWFRAGGIRDGQDPYHVHYARIDFDGSNLTLLTSADATHEIEFSPDRRHYIDTYSRVDLPPVHEVRRSGDGSLACELEHANWEQLLATGWQPPERFHAPGRDRVSDIWGVIYKPTDFDPSRKYPVIEKIYSGPHSAHVPKAFASYRKEQSLAELGFIVVQIDGMGTSQRSKAFHDVCWQNLGDAGFPDRIAWLRAAAAERPWMDLERIGIYGGSAGGQNALRALIAHGDFYDAAVADCGCHDNRMDKIWWNEQWMGWPVGPHYEESSNVSQAHRMQGRLLLTVGELDRNVDPASTMQVVNALIRADKDFELVIFPGAGHGIGSGRYGTRRMYDFFVRSLWGTTPRNSDPVSRVEFP